MKNMSKVPVKRGQTGGLEPAAIPMWQPFESLRREVERLFSDFDQGFTPETRRLPLDVGDVWRGRGNGDGFPAAPAVDVVERDDAYVVSAELPGLDDKDVEVEVSDECLTLRGEKQEEKDEKKAGYHLQERRFGSFERSFRLPEGVDAERIAAGFTKGVLTVTLPKKPEAKKAVRKVEVKGG